MTDFSNWKGCPPPERKVLEGRYCRLEPFNVEKHAESLYAASTAPGVEERYKFLFISIPRSLEEFKLHMEEFINNKHGSVYFSVVDKRTGRAEGRVGLIYVDPENGAVEFGNVVFGPALKRTRAATEAFYLTAKYVFSLGYRRFVWRCNEHHVFSQRAAERYGFKVEGTLRNLVVNKGKSVDVRVYSMLDSEWPPIKEKLEAWLSPDNFDAKGNQKQRLAI